MHVCVSRGSNGVWGSVLRRPEWFRIEWSLTAFTLQPYFGSLPPSSTHMQTHARTHTRANAHAKFRRARVPSSVFPVTLPLNDSKLAAHSRAWFQWVICELPAVYLIPPSRILSSRSCSISAAAQAWRGCRRKKKSRLAPTSAPPAGTSVPVAESKSHHQMSPPAKGIPRGLSGDN